MREFQSRIPHLRFWSEERNPSINHMSATLAERVETLEHEMAEVLKKLPSHGEPSPQGWMNTFGMVANESLFEVR